MSVLISAARRAEVLQWVQSHGVVQVNELARSLGVSPSTIRRDLSQMEVEGLLRRVHGGAMVEEGPAVEPQHRERAIAAAAEKRRIAARAARLLDDNATILISGGTTTELMLPLLTGRGGLTVVTNSLNVAGALAETPDVRVIVLGGYLRHGERSLLGHLTRLALGELIIDRMFTGAFGLDERGVTGADIAEAETDQHLVDAARELVVLADASKFDHRGPVRLASTERITTLITDDRAGDDKLAPWRAADVDVVVV
jgi:DeoR/GlpR family transcriptional regulator of sugar metabolism